MLDKRVVDYTVLYAFDLGNLRTDMVKYLNMGREPFGNIRVIITGDKIVPYKYYQPIVKYKYLYINPEKCEKITGSISKQPWSINDMSEENVSELDSTDKE